MHTRVREEFGVLLVDGRVALSDREKRLEEVLVDRLMQKTPANGNTLVKRESVEYSKTARKNGVARAEYSWDGWADG